MNNQKEQNTNSSKIEDEASEWVIRNERGLTAAEQDQFNEWLTSKPAHRQIYHNFSKGWSDLDRLAGLQTSYTAPIDPGLLAERSKRPRRKPIVLFKRTIKYSLPLAACLLLVLVFISQKQQPESIRIDSLVQERSLERIRQETLEDGSIVSLNWDALVEVEYTRSERLVRLWQGEANFKVEKDIQRPFVVEVDGIHVKAVGTEFNVRRDSSQFDVIVTEGSVLIEVSNSNEELAAFPANSLLQANYKAVVGLHGTEPTLEVTVLEREEVAHELLWQPKLIHFENATLDVIVGEFNKRNAKQIILNDPSLQSIRLNSVFWSDNIEGFVRLLESTFQIQVHIEGNQIHLSRELPQTRAI